VNAGCATPRRASLYPRFWVNGPSAKPSGLSDGIASDASAGCATPRQSNHLGKRPRGKAAPRPIGDGEAILCWRPVRTASKAWLHTVMPVRDTPTVQAGAAPGTIRVLVADERPLFARAVQTQLASHPRFELVGVAFDGEEAVELAAELLPDVILIDADLPEVDGLEATRRICEASSPRMVILTGAERDLDSVEAHDAGAGAYLPKVHSAAELVDTLEFTALLLDAADALPNKP
jgi:CheY-like chemotaxis protein